MYNIDFNKLASQLLAVFLRKIKMLAWVKLMFYPLRFVNDALLLFIDQKRLEISYNGQTMVLERALNNEYPDAFGGIWIDNDVEILPRQYAFFECEAQGNLGFVYFQSEGEGSLGYAYYASEYANDVDFIVNVPATLTFDEMELRAYINKYRSAGKLFKIQTY